VCTTSDSTGTPALLHDRGTLVVYNVLGHIRSLPTFLSSPRNIGALLRDRGRLEAVFVTGGHFLGNTMSARRIRKMPWRAKTQRIFSALTPITEQVRELNAFQSVMVGGYPRALEVLAGVVGGATACARCCYLIDHARFPIGSFSYTCYTLRVRDPIVKT
jgi:hypothetical protein